MENVMKKLDRLSKRFRELDKQDVVPRGGITGCGISQVQYDKPPTEEERQKPWIMRVKQRITLIEENSHKPALIWDSCPGITDSGRLRIRGTFIKWDPILQAAIRDFSRCDLKDSWRETGAQRGCAIFIAGSMSIVLPRERWVKRDRRTNRSY
eukprot:scaffold1137_cov247-Chaetoceros_neogracile.AAC.9